MKCHICGNDIKKEAGRHIYFCAKKNGILDSKPSIRHKQLCFKTGINLTKEFMETEYINNLKSLPDFKREFGLNYCSTQFLLRYFSIPIRNIKESSNEKRKGKYRKTCTDRYGVVNVSQIDAVKDKKKDTSFKNYGVDNIWKKRDFIIQRMIEKYGQGSVPNINGRGNFWGWKTATEDQKKHRIDLAQKGYKKYLSELTDDQREELNRKKMKNLITSFTSKIEQRVRDILSSIGISYTWQKWISQKSFDFHISGTKILIEVNGDYWHANPEKYKADDVLSFPKGDVLAKELWRRDLIKKEIAEKYGYKVIYLWEKEINSLSDENLTNRILREFVF